MIVVGIISLIFSLTAISVSLYVYRKTKAITSYSNIDHLYFELLKLGIEHPEFVNPDYTQDYERKFDGNDRFRYDLYAFSAWNICETIYDRRKDSGLLESWDPVLRTENHLHRKWLDQPANRTKFKQSFVRYINEEKDQEGSSRFPQSYLLIPSRD